MADEIIKVYGAPWCGDCARAKAYLDSRQVAYEWTDIDQDPAAKAYVKQVNGGKQIIPTIIFPDGSMLVEPTNAQLARKLGR